MTAPTIDLFTPEERARVVRVLATFALAWASRILADEAPAAAEPVAPPPHRRVQDYPHLLKVEDLAEILRLHEKTILAAVVKGDRTKVPGPALLGPYRWRRADVQAFIEDATEFEQRRSRLNAAAGRRGGQKGGRSRSPKKQQAAAENGRLGGRPKKGIVP